MARTQHSSFINASSIHPIALDRSEYMSRDTLNLFKEFLVLWKTALIADSQVDLEVLKDDVTQISADLSDQATYEESISLHVRTRDRERKLLKKIDESLILIEKGDYGYCLECGVDIGYERMIARPTADMCIDCKTASEIKEKHTGQYIDNSDE
jgi:DnaK suppressor protein